MSDIEIPRDQHVVLPAQPSPRHEQLDSPSGPPPVAHWAEHTRSRYVAGVVLALGIAGFVACLAVTIVTRSVPAAIALGACLVGVIVIRAAMMSADRTTVDLRGSLLTVAHDGAVHTIDLASNVRIIETRGEPDSSAWRLLAETADGQVLQLGPREVDAAVIEAALRYYREVAAGKHPRRDPINWRG